MCLMDEEKYMKSKYNCMVSQGFTLLELMVTVAVLGILVGLAAPSYHSMMMRQKVRSVMNEWKSSFYFAQSEALRLKDGVLFCAADSSGKRCNNSNNFSNGWLVLHEIAGKEPVILQDTPLMDKNINITLSISPGGFNGQLKFLGNGRLNINAGGSLTVESKSHKLKVNITSAGRLRGV